MPVQSGSVKQLPNGNYMLSCGKRIVPRKGDPDQTAAAKLFGGDRFYTASHNGNGNDNKDKGLSIEICFVICVIFLWVFLYF